MMTAAEMYDAATLTSAVVLALLPLGATVWSTWRAPVRGENGELALEGDSRFDFSSISDELRTAGSQSIPVYLVGLLHE